MTPEQEVVVLYWLRSQGTKPTHNARKILQDALRDGDDISQDIRDAMADWIQDNPGSLFHAYGASRPVLQALGLMPKPAPNSPVPGGEGLHNAGNRLQASLEEERSAKLQARINDNPEVKAFIARHRAPKPAPASPADPEADS